MLRQRLEELERTISPEEIERINKEFIKECKKVDSELYRTSFGNSLKNRLLRLLKL